MIRISETKLDFTIFDTEIYTEGYHDSLMWQTEKVEMLYIM